MNKIINTLAIVFAFYPGMAMAVQGEQITTAALNLDVEAYQAPSLNRKRGLLETTGMSIGTILKSHHFSDQDYNETHDGIYLSVDKWSFGTYRNSSDVQSTFVTYNPTLYRNRSVEINFVAGVADGYSDWEGAQGDYLPLLGVSAQWMYLKTMLSYDLIAVGVELPLN